MDNAYAILNRIADTIINPLIIVFFGAALVVFFWGVFEFIKGDAADDKGKGRNHMIYGVLGLAVMISVYGIINFVTGIVLGPSSNNGNTIYIPPAGF